MHGPLWCVAASPSVFRRAGVHDRCRAARRRRRRGIVQTDDGGSEHGLQGTGFFLPFTATLDYPNGAIFLTPTGDSNRIKKS